LKVEEMGSLRSRNVFGAQEILTYDFQAFYPSFPSFKKSQGKQKLFLKKKSKEKEEEPSSLGMIASGV